MSKRALIRRVAPTERLVAEVQARATYANALVEMSRSTGVIREKSRIG